MSREDFRYKQVIVVRTDLGMGKGKVAAQVGHAAITAAEETRRRCPDWLRAWMNEGQRKVVVKVKGLDELLGLQQKAMRLKVPHSLVTDRGRTQLPPNTVTCLGIGPAPQEKMDRITGDLKLL
ncbi:MAG: peptidyl-tRNA hydrolase [Candidatus Bathyarchaeota archaeon]|jgi:PTH2 family peptidyl-tRNA hydrolase|nr:MAG: peptidyl-tRNA hydrolase [Candidatus Bathyarchaeota archaeon]